MKSESKSKSGHDWIKYWIEIAGILFGIIGVCVLIFQSCELVKATKATLKSVEVSRGQLNEMQQARIMDERAWVAVRQGVIRGSFLPNITFEVVFRNTGKTPAVNVTAYMNQSIFTNSIPQTDQPTSPTNTLGGVQFSGLLAPDADGSISVSSFFISFSDPNQQAISSGKKPYYVYGTIWYDDIFGKHHWSQFCYEIRLTPDADYPAQFLPINIHNSCDDAQTNQTTKNSN
jgi:hypothetical protein